MTNPLEQVLEALESVEWHGGGSCWVLDPDKIEAAITTLRAHIEAEKGDAARWRVARQNPRLLFERWEPISLSPEECDAAIDAAIQAGTSERGEG